MSENRTFLDGGVAGAGSGRATWVRWQLIGLLMAYSMANWFNRVSVSVADLPLINEFHLTSPQIGVIDSALLLAYTLCMTPGGWLIDRFGPRRALIVMGFGSALFVALTGLAGSAWLGAGLVFVSFLVIRALMGALSAPIYPASAKLVGHWIPFDRQAWANGLINGAAPLGMAIAHVGFGGLCDTYGWRAAFVITGTCTAVLALVWTAYGRDYPSQHPAVNEAELRLIQAGSTPATLAAGNPGAKAGRVAWSRLLRNRSLIFLTLSYATVGYFEYLDVFCTEYYFKQVLGISVDDSRRYSSYATLAMAVTMPLGGFFSDRLVRRFGYRLGRASMPVLGLLGSASTLIALCLTRDPSWSLAWFIVGHACIALTEGAFWTTAIDLGGRQGGSAAGILNTGGNVLGSLAPTVTRWLGAYLNDWRPGFYLGSVICLLGVSFWWGIDPTERTPEGEESSP